MSNEQNIDFSSKNIKKQDIDFNIEEKKSTKFKAKLANFKAKLKSLWAKFLSLPFMRGKNKFITLGVAVVVIAVAITLPIVLPRILAGTPLVPEPVSEQTEEEKSEERENVADTVNNLDPNASDETRDAILADLDAKILTASDPVQRRFFTQSKALALQKYGMYSDAIDILEPIAEELHEDKDWTSLSRLYAFISEIYASAGDKDAAIQAMKNAISAIAETAKDNEYGIEANGRESFEKRLQELQNS